VLAAGSTFQIQLGSGPGHCTPCAHSFDLSVKLTLQINRRTKQRAQQYENELHRTDLPSGLHSVTQENDLDEFLNTAQLAGTDFTAERTNAITLVSATSTDNPYLLSATAEQDLKQKQQSNQDAIRVPRRPEWTPDMDKDHFERNERAAFLEWRRSLAE
jgi:large subunit GTPase 1